MPTRAIVYGDHVNTDVIIPARHMNISTPEHLAAHCMEDLDPDFADKAKNGAIIVAGKNFGCGSSREHAPVALKAANVRCVIADSFARIFYRNSLNIGLPILECAEATRSVKEGDLLDVDVGTGVITNHTQHKTYQAIPFPPFMQKLIELGGLVNAVKAGAL